MLENRHRSAFYACMRAINYGDGFDLIRFLSAIMRLSAIFSGLGFSFFFFFFQNNKDQTERQKTENEDKL